MLDEQIEKRTTLDDLARETGFAVSTVSRALRDDPSVNDVTRKTVHDVARKLGYNYERLRSGVASRGIKQVRFIVSSIFNADRARPGAHDNVITGLRRYVDETKGEIIVVGSDTTMTNSDLQRCTGAVFVMPDTRTPILEKCINARIPIAVVCRSFAEANICIRPDDAEVVRLGFTHLAKLGHTRLGFAGQDPNNLAMKDRARAFQELCTEHGKLSTVTWFTGNVGHDLNIIRDLKNSKAWPSAWVCGSDHVAADLIRTCYEAGISVPDQAAIVGIGNLDVCDWMQPTLTSVAVQHEEMGYWAGKLLATYAPMIPGSMDLVFDSQLVQRRSCGNAHSAS